MIKRILPFILFISPFSLSAKNLPPVIDLNSYPSVEDGYLDQGHYSQYSQDAFDVGVYAFNYAPELTPLFASLKKNYQIDAVVETGTFYGASTAIFSLLFDEVHTIEVLPSTFAIALENLKGYPNVHCHLGHSAPTLLTVLELLKKKRVLFYLDAHWYDDFPLLQEITSISRTHRDNCIIVIDDFKVPDRDDIDYDKYPSGQCSLEYIENSLRRLFSDYSVHFIIPKNKKSRAKVIILPKRWDS